MIFCVEDDNNIRDLLVYTLETTGFHAKGLADPLELWQALAQEEPELILLDIMLPGEDGYSILDKLKKSSGTRDIPVIMVTAKEAEFDKVRALESGDVPGFLSLINASGASSWEYLQNIAPAGAAEHQALAVTLALCRRMLRGRGAVRVHGGGFAGTALCIVPEEKLPAFCRELETHLAPGCCHRLHIR